MYDNIAALRFVKGSNNEMSANAMISSEKEIMPFRTPVAAEGRVEDWMTEVLQEMRKTNRLITKEAIFFYCDGKTRWVDYKFLIIVLYLQLEINKFYSNKKYIKDMFICSDRSFLLLECYLLDKSCKTNSSCVPGLFKFFFNQ